MVQCILIVSEKRDFAEFKMFLLMLFGHFLDSMDCGTGDRALFRHDPSFHPIPHALLSLPESILKAKRTLVPPFPSMVSGPAMPSSGQYSSSPKSLDSRSGLDLLLSHMHLGQPDASPDVSHNSEIITHIPSESAYRG
jgi:hypothetical protein